MISERISYDIPPQMKILNIVIPILMHFCSFVECWKPHKAAHHPTRRDVINDVKLFPPVYRRIYCRKFLTLSNQTSCYKIKCIRIQYLFNYSLPPVAADSVGSFLIELILSLTSKETFNELYEELFQGRLFQFSIHPKANFVLQRLIKGCADKEMVIKFRIFPLNLL